MEEELRNADPDDSDFDSDLDSEVQDLSMCWNGEKFPSYPREEDPVEAFDTAETHLTKRSSSSHHSELRGLTFSGA